MSTTSPNIGLNIPVGTDTVDFDKFFIQNLNAIDGQFASGTTANRPSSPKVGQRYFNTDSKKLELWDGATWIKISIDLSTPWVNLTLQNGWSATANGLTTATTPQYRKNAFGELELRGLLGGGTVTQGTVIANLPVGFRPVQETRLIVAKHDGGGFSPGLLYIYPTGDISSIVLSNYFVSFANIPPMECQ